MPCLAISKPDDALSLIADCAARSPGGQIMSDSIPHWLSRSLRRIGALVAPSVARTQMHDVTCRHGDQLSIHIDAEPALLVN